METVDTYIPSIQASLSTDQGKAMFNNTDTKFKAYTAKAQEIINKFSAISSEEEHIALLNEIETSLLPAYQDFSAAAQELMTLKDTQGTDLNASLYRSMMIGLIIVVVLIIVGILLSIFLGTSCQQHRNPPAGMRRTSCNVQKRRCAFTLPDSQYGR